MPFPASTSIHWGPNGALLAVLNTLRNNLPAQLDRTWAEWADVDAASGLVVPEVYPATYYRHQRAIRLDYPHIQAYSVGGQMGADRSSQDAEWVHRVMVEWWIRGDNEESLQEQSGRWCWSIWRTLAQHTTLDGSMYALSSGAPNRYELRVGQASDGRALSCRGRLPINVQTIEVC